MKHYLTFLIILTALLSACTPRQQAEEERAGRYGYRGDTGTMYHTPPPPPPVVDEQMVGVRETEQAEPEEVVQEQRERQESESGDYPYGTPVPGRPGLVTSPYAPNDGLIDVTGLLPGQEVICPWTEEATGQKRIFLVP